MATRIPFRGVLLDQQTVTAFLAAERMVGWSLEIMQGSWSTGVAASAGTHAGGGALDVSLRDAAGNLRPDLEQTRIVWAMRRAGLRTWRRTPDQGFPYHAHGIMRGDPLVSPAAAAQLVQWDAGQNGLADHGPDDDPINVAAGRPAVLAPGAVVSRTMYDSVDVSSVPSGAGMVAGYVDGNYANMSAMIARFPHAVHVPIAVFAHTNDGTVLDVETGDATPAQAVGWVQMRRAAGIDPSVYCNTSTWGAVKAAFSSAGVAPPHYWVAQYDGDPAIPAGAVAKQYADPGPYDVSSVADVWPGIDTGADMPLTPADVQMIWDHMEVNHASGNPVRMGTVLSWMDYEHGQQVSSIEGAMAAAVQAGTAAALAPISVELSTVIADLTAMSALLAGLESPTALQVQTGMNAALRQLGAVMVAIPAP